MTLRFKLGPVAPIEACKLAYVKGQPINVRENIRLLDLSHKKNENVSVYSDSQILVHHLSGETVDTNKIVMSNVSLLDKVGTATPLFYKHVIGNGRYDVLNKAADETDLEVAKNQIKAGITLLDINDNEIISNSWDIRVTSFIGSNRFSVDMYVDRRGSLGSVFKIKYNSFDTLSSLFLPNHIEVVNPIEYIIEDTDYTLTYVAIDNDYTVASAITSPAINIFSELETSVSVTVNSTDVVIGSSTIPHNNRRIHEICHDINKADEGVSAYPASQGVVDSIASGSFTVESYGLQLFCENAINLRYDEETRIRIKLPTDLSSAHAWNPRIGVGKFNVKDEGLMYSIPEYHEQAWSESLGKPYKEVVAERIDPYIYNDRVYDRITRVNHRPLHPTAPITITYNGIVQVDAIKDVDRSAGIIFLNEVIPQAGDVQVRYSYEETDFVYRGLDLNPTRSHNPDILNKFIGIYIIPSITTVQMYPRAVYHMIRDTQKEIEDEMLTMEYDDATSVKPFLIGLYQVSEASRFNELDVIDIRLQGGGLVEGDWIPDMDYRNPESEQFLDIGRVDGKPFQGASVIVLDLPSEIIGDERDCDVALRPSEITTGDEFLKPSGIFTKEELEDLVYQNIPAGHFVVFNYEDYLNDE
jgi:hypothetical protein